MLFEGLKLMVLGISMVFLFLILLNVGINVMGNLFKSEVDREIDEMEKAAIASVKASKAQAKAKAAKAQAEDAKLSAKIAQLAGTQQYAGADQGAVVAAISAAIAKFRTEKK